MKHVDSYSHAVLYCCIGAVLSSLITALVYVIVMNGAFENVMLMVAIIMLFAVAQLIIQLYFFLHIAKGEKPRWRLYSLWFVALTVLIVFIGSIWIMKNLDYNMGMSPEQMHRFMLEENKKGF